MTLRSSCVPVPSPPGRSRRSSATSSCATRGPDRARGPDRDKRSGSRCRMVRTGQCDAHRADHEAGDQVAPADRSDHTALLVSSTRVDGYLLDGAVPHVPPVQDPGVAAAAQQLLEGTLNGNPQTGLSLGDEDAVRPRFVLQGGRELVLRPGADVVDEEDRGRIVVEHGYRATRAQLNQCVRVRRIGVHDDPLVDAAQLGPLEQIHLSRAALDGDHLAAQVIELGDAGRVAALHDDRGARPEVVDEVPAPGALRSVGHGRDGEVETAARDPPAQLDEVDVAELEPYPQDPSDLDPEVGLNADDGETTRAE